MKATDKDFQEMTPAALYELGLISYHERTIQETAAALKGLGVMEVHLKSRYGTTFIYPGDLLSSLFLQLTRRKTFTEADLFTIRSLGYQVNEVEKL